MARGILKLRRISLDFGSRRALIQLAKLELPFQIGTLGVKTEEIEEKGERGERGEKEEVAEVEEVEEAEEEEGVKEEIGKELIMQTKKRKFMLIK